VILATAGQPRILMEERSLSLQDAHKLNVELLASPSTAQEDFAGWPEVAARFLKIQNGQHSSTLRKP